METFREISITSQGFLYRHYKHYLHLQHKRISPQSYRAGERMGMMTGFIFGCVFCVLTSYLIMGYLVN